MSKAAFVSLITAALAVRLALVATTFGSTDALLLMAYTHLAERFGIGPAYHYAAYLNHPPLSGLIMIAADKLGRGIGLEFPDVFRLFQIVGEWPARSRQRVDTIAETRIIEQALQ